jgi:hypothetical protein
MQRTSGSGIRTTSGYSVQSFGAFRALLTLGDDARDHEGVRDFCELHGNKGRIQRMIERVKNYCVVGDAIVEKTGSPRRIVLPSEMFDLAITIATLQVEQTGRASAERVVELLSSRFVVGRDDGVFSGPFTYASPTMAHITELSGRSLEQHLSDVSRMAAAAEGDSAVRPFISFLPREWPFPGHKEANWRAAVADNFSPRRLLIPGLPSDMNRILAALAAATGERYIAQHCTVSYSDTRLDETSRRAALSHAADLMHGAALAATSSSAAASGGGASSSSLRTLRIHYKCARGVGGGGAAGGDAASPAVAAARAAAAAAAAVESEGDSSESDSDAEHVSALSAVDDGITAARQMGRKAGVHTGCGATLCVTVAPGAPNALLELAGEHNHVSDSRL